MPRNSARWEVGRYYLWLLPCVGLLMIGCANHHAEAPDAAAAELELARTTAEYFNQSMYGKKTEAEAFQAQFPHLDIKKVSGIYGDVAARINKNDSAGIAALINQPGEWQKTMWYPIMATSFAEYFQYPRPICMKNADRVIAALRQLTDRRYYRQTRVCAAKALQFDDPGLAKKTLEEEYANFEVLPLGKQDMLFPSKDVPQDCRSVLLQLGTGVLPREVTSIDDIAEVLMKKGYKVNLDDEKQREILAEVGTQFNALLRKAFVEKDASRLEMLCEPEFRKAALLELHQDVSKNWKGPKNPRPGGLFMRIPESDLKEEKSEE